jgi:hypothetical protein
MGNVLARVGAWLAADARKPASRRATPSDRASDKAPITGTYEQWFADLRRRLGLVGAVDIDDFIASVEAYLGYPLLVSCMVVEDAEVYGAVRPHQGQGIIGVRYDLQPRMFLRVFCHELAHVLRGHKNDFFCEDVPSEAEDVEAEAIALIIETYLKDQPKLSPVQRFWKQMGS